MCRVSFEFSNKVLNWLFCFIFVFVSYNKQLNNLDSLVVT